MPTFDCEGMDKNGREYRQRIEAADEIAAREQLRATGIFCTNIRQVESAFLTVHSTRVDLDALDAQLLQLLRERRMIDAVKLHRESKGCNLREAKNYVDALAQRNGVESSGCAIRFGVLLLLMAGGLLAALLSV